jgi:hypothetical protein
MYMSAESVQKWRNETKKRAIEVLGGQCCICGYRRCYGGLHFHHADPKTKTTTIASMLKTPTARERIGEELSKCVLICGNCHAENHAGLTEIPFDAKRCTVEEFLKVWERDQEEYFCEVCGLERARSSTRFCSMRCAGKVRMKIAWESIDLKHKISYMTIQEIADELGVGSTAIRKRLGYLNIVNPRNNTGTNIYIG